ncbi:MAG: hypothetical protein M3Z03_07215 [Actinomycetota bacterium]|nr:hypothetical protein [Actinomycetota bacterium]
MTNSSQLIRRTIAGATAGLIAGTVLTSGLASPAAAAPTGIARVVGTTLEITLADNATSELRATPSGSTYRFRDILAPLAPGEGCTAVASAIPQVECTGYDRVLVRAGSQVDVVHLAAVNLPVEVDGGTGDDYIVGGRKANRLVGGDGADALYAYHPDHGAVSLTQRASFPSSTLIGGAGGDELYGGYGADDISGGAGSDSLTYVLQYGAPGAPTVAVLLDDEANDGRIGEGDLVRTDIEAVVGGAGDDYLWAKSLPVRSAGVYLAGADGIDQIVGGDGADFLVGGPGNDQIVGMGGNDVLYGNGGDDFLFGMDGNDELYGEGGVDGAWGLDGQDTCDAEDENDCEL